MPFTGPEETAIPSTKSTAAGSSSAGKAPSSASRPDAELFSVLVASIKDYAVFLLDPTGHVMSWNIGAEGIKGYSAEEIIGKHFSIFYPPKVAESGFPQEELRRAVAEGHFEDEGWRLRKDGSRFWANVVITPLYGTDGKLRAFAKVTRDLTERKMAEQAQRESAERYRMLVDGVSEYAIFMLDPEGHVLTWNASAERINGYKAEEIVGLHFSKFYPEEIAARNWPRHELETAKAEGRFEDEGWRVRKDGSRYWANVVITALRDPGGRLYGFSKVTRDMTQRRKWEDQVTSLNSELRILSSRLLRVQDDERRRIAHELHESLGQELSAMKVMLDSALRRGAFDQTTAEIVTQSVALADRVLEGLRSLSYLLHPPLLEERGISAALRWYVDGYQRRSGVRVELVFSPEEFPRVSPQLESAVFRIVQEGLTNVSLHSGSNRAEVSVKIEDDDLILLIRDFGSGISLAIAEGTSAVGLGISGMRERVNPLGGHVTIHRLDPGTMVEVRLPLSTDGK